MNIAETVQDIIDGEEIDRYTPAEVIAGIQAAMQEIEHLRELNQKQAQMVFDLMGRIDRMTGRVKLEHETLKWRVLETMEMMTRGGTHRDKDENQLVAIASLLGVIKDCNRLIEWLESASKPSNWKPMHEDNNIPF